MPCTGPTAMGTKSCSRGTLTPPWYRGFQCCSQTDRKDRRCMTQCSCLGKDADTTGLKKNPTHKRHFQPTASSQRSASLGALNSQRLGKIISMLARRFLKEFYQVVHFFLTCHTALPMFRLNPWTVLRGFENFDVKAMKITSWHVMLNSIASRSCSKKTSFELQR